MPNNSSLNGEANLLVRANNTDAAQYFLQPTRPPPVATLPWPGAAGRQQADVLS
jgi:hypothetical protein